MNRDLIKDFLTAGVAAGGVSRPWENAVIFESSATRLAAIAFCKDWEARARAEAGCSISSTIEANGTYVVRLHFSGQPIKRIRGDSPGVVLGAEGECVECGGEPCDRTTELDRLLASLSVLVSTSKPSDGARLHRRLRVLLEHYDYVEFPLSIPPAVAARVFKGRSIAFWVVCAVIAALVVAAAVAIKNFL